MRVKIDAGGRVVEIETASDQNLTHDDVAKTALNVWQQTDGAPTGAGPAYGFSAERRPSPTGHENGIQHVSRSPLPVRVEVE